MLAITTYQWFLAAHVIAAVLWVGGGASICFLSMAARRQGETAKEVDFALLAGKIGGPVYGLSSFLLLGFGFALVENGNWGYDRFFVQFGLAAWLFSAVLGIFYYSRELKGLAAAYERGPEDLEVRMRLTRFYRVGALDVAVLIAAVFVMSAKPWL